MIETLETVTTDRFDEAAYLLANPDIAIAVRAGRLPSGRAHYDMIGHSEGRFQVNPAVRRAKSEKLERARGAIDWRLVRETHSGGALDCMSDEMRAQIGDVEAAAVSANDYDPVALKFIVENPDKLALDAGAGFRKVYHPNVVNFEIAPYASTDVIGVGEQLPFVDDAFDFVVSSAVLEHVRDPFGCAKELYRVLKPGGELFVAVPFLQPYHGYPHHYYNMTRDGLRNLFPESLEVMDHYVPHYFKPLWVAEWFFRVWADGLSPRTKAEFLEMRVGDFLGATVKDYARPFVSELDAGHNLTLASGTVLRGRKRKE